MKTQKGFIPLLIAIIVGIVLVAGGGRYYFLKKDIQDKENIKPERATENQPQKLGDSSTADWKTYKNEKYGFGFRYPNDWYAHEWLADINGRTDILSIYNQKIEDGYPASGYVGISFSILPIRDDFEDWVNSESILLEKKNSLSEDNKITGIKFSRGVLNGKKIYTQSYEYSSSMEGPLPAVKVVAIDLGNKVFLIQASAPLPAGRFLVGKVEEISKTLKFTK